MTQFIINKRTDAQKTDVNLLNLHKQKTFRDTHKHDFCSHFKKSEQELILFRKNSFVVVDIEGFLFLTISHREFQGRA